MKITITFKLLLSYFNISGKLLNSVVNLRDPTEFSSLPDNLEKDNLEKDNLEKDNLEKDNLEKAVNY